ncbi:MAG: chloride channel protein [Eubacteriales bacterium]
MKMREWLNKFLAWGKLQSSYFWTITRWLIYAVVTGVICGFIGIGFDYYLEFASESFSTHPWLIFGLPLCGLVIVWLYKRCRVKKDNGFEMILESVRENTKVPYLCAPLVFLCTGLTHLFGGSSGREGAALQIGGTVGTLIGRSFHFHEKETNILALCGMSALFSAVFGTPVTAAILAIEIVSTDGIYYMAFFPCLIAAMIAYLLAGFCGVIATADRFSTVEIPALTGNTFLRVLLAAVLFSAVTILFVTTVKLIKALFRKLFKHHYPRIFVGGILLLVMTGAVFLATGTFDYNGAGMALVVKAVSGEARPEAFLLKILFTAVTLGCGFKGGKIVPAFCIGATFGCVIAPLIGLDPGFCATLGMIALFSGMDNCPLAAIMLAAELFGSNYGADGFVFFTTVCAAAYMLTGYFCLYSGRENIYSSLLMEYVHKPKSELDEDDSDEGVQK